MSYRDLKNFTEHLRTLGYDKNVSLESFRQPNFPLVADVLHWIAECFDPDSKLDGGINTIDERISLIRSATQFMLLKSNVKLNAKRLYGADGYAVKELLKLTSILYDALKISQTQVEDPETDEDPSFQFDISSKMDDLKYARQLTTDITANGAMLYDLLGKESDYREIREQAISRPLDINNVEAAIEKACVNYEKELRNIQEQIENVAASEASLDSKIEKKKAELERSEKRLQAIQKIKPAYQSEFKNLEIELEKLYDEYVLKLRCIEALKQQLSTLEAAEAEVAEERRHAAMKLAQKYEAEDVLNLSDTELDYDDSPRKDFKNIEKRPVTRPRTRLRVRTAAGGRSEQSKVFGSMSGNNDEMSLDDHSLGDDDDLLGDNLDDDDLKALDLGDDEFGSLGSSDDSNLKTEDGIGNNIISHETNHRNFGRRDPAIMGSNPSVNKRTPSAKPGNSGPGLQDILSDDDDF